MTRKFIRFFKIWHALAQYCSQILICFWSMQLQQQIVHEKITKPFNKFRISFFSVIRQLYLLFAKQGFHSIKLHIFTVVINMGNIIMFFIREAIHISSATASSQLPSYKSWVVTPSLTHSHPPTSSWKSHSVFKVSFPKLVDIFPWTYLTDWLTQNVFFLLLCLSVGSFVH